MSNLRVNSIIPSVGTNVAIGTAGGTITYNANAVSYGGTEALSVNSSGRIGIGTNNPQVKLEVKQSSLRQGIRIQHENNDSTLRLYVDSSDSTAAINASYVSTGSYLPLTFLTSDIERLRIDTSGRVTLPYQPAFRTNGTNYSQSAGAFSIIIPNTVVYNQGSHYNGSTGRFTAPVAGRYIFGFWGLSYPHNTEINQIRAYVNGSADGETVQFGGAAHLHIHHSGSIFLNLNANDIFDFRYYQSSGSAKAYSNQWNMWGYLVG